MDPDRQHKVQIQLLKDEFVLFKMELVSKMETQFLNIKSQIAQMMEEISHQSETIQAVKSSVSTLREYLDLMNVGFNKHNFQPPLLVNSQTGLNRLRQEDEIIVSEVNRPNTRSFNEIKRKFQKVNKFLVTTYLNDSKSNFLRTQEKDNLLQDCRLKETSHYKETIQPRIKSCCWTCKSKKILHKEENKRNRKTFVKVKKLEKKLKECLKFSSTFMGKVTQQLQDVNEKIDENSFDIEQCWKDMEEIRNTSRHVMINGDLVSLEDEISRMNFALEALLLQMDEQSQEQLQLKEIQEKLHLTEIQEKLQLKEIQEKLQLKDTILTNQLEFTTRMMNERLQKLENLRDNLSLVLDSKGHEFRTFPVKTAEGTKWKLDPVELQDVMITKGISQNIRCKIQCLTAMRQYKDMSLEELRHLDYEGLDVEAETSRLELIKNAFKKCFPSCAANCRIVLGHKCEGKYQS